MTEMSGGMLQKNVIHLAHQYGWRVAHFRSVQTASGRWETPVAGDGLGYPDLFLVHPQRQEFYWREIKGQRESVRPAQKQWGDWLTAAGCDWAIWRPADWAETIVPLLTFERGVVQ